MARCALLLVLTAAGCSLLLPDKPTADRPDADADSDLDADLDRSSDASETGPDSEADRPDGDADGSADADHPRPDADAETDGDGPVTDTVCHDGLPGLLFCDGFEAPLLDTWTDTHISGGTAELQDAEVYRGHGALRAEISHSSHHASVLYGDLGGVTSGELYVRAYFLLSAAHPLSEVIILYLGNDGSVRHHITVHVPGDGVPGIWMDEHDVWAPASAPLVPLGTWFCLQLHVSISDTDGTVDLFIDGDPAISASSSDTLPARGYEHLRVGITYAVEGQGPFVLFVDEVVVGTEPIPCDPV